MTSVSEWARVEAEIEAIVGARPDAYDAAVRQNLAALIDLLRTTNRPAPHVEPGYWPTFSVTWALPGFDDLEIEVFGDRYEIYRSVIGKIDIRHEAHGPGEAMSSLFVSELPPPM